MSAAQVGADRVRVTFSSLVSSLASLQLPATYALTGPSTRGVAGIQAVPGDLDSLDLLISSALDPGTWSLAVSGITGSPVSFTAIALGSTEGVAAGSKNDDAEKIIRKHLPLSLVGKAWDALIYALSIGDQYNFDNARLAFDQLYLTSASGIYLDRKASDNGVVRPADLGMPEDLFRKLAIQTSTEKLTDEALLQILEIFYGVDSLRASAVTSIVEPFVLQDGQDLQILLDERVAVHVVFSSLDCTLIQAAKAIEVAAAINRSFRAAGCLGFAIPYPDPAGAGNRVKVYSPSLGLSSSVRVTGGMAQSALGFNDPLTVFTGTITSGDAYNWVVTVPRPGINRISLSTAGLLKVDLSTPRTGDYMIFSAANSTIPDGVYPIQGMGRSYSGGTLTQYLEIAGVSTAHSFLQLSNSEMLFYRPTKRTIYQSQRTVALSAPGLGTTIDLTIPATTQAVGRQLKSAAYMHSQPALPISSLQRVGSTVTVTTSANHGLSVGGSIIVDGAFGTTNGPGINVGAAGVSGSAGTANASLATCWTSTRAQDMISGQGETVIPLNDGRILICGGDYQSGGTVMSAACQLFRITASALLSDGSRQYSYNWITDTNRGVTQSGGVGLVLPSDSIQSGKAFVCGGYNASSSTSTTQMYTPAPAGGNSLGSWATLASMSVNRYRHTAAPVLIAGLNKILVAGGTTAGLTAAGGAVASCEIFDPVAATWANTSAMSKARVSHTATQLLDGRVLVAGGNDNSASPVYHSSCEIFDGSAWSIAGRMTWQRSNHTATRLPDGRVLVIGGTGSPGTGSASAAPLFEAEIYDPTTGSWRSAGRSAYARSGHAAVYLASKGLVLISGGGIDVPEYWDPKTFSFRIVPQSVPGTTACPAIALCVDPTSGSTLALVTAATHDDATSLSSYLYAPGQDGFASGGISGCFRVSAVLSPVKFQFTTPTSGMATNTNASATITAGAAASSGSMVGPYVLNPASGVAVTGIEDTTTMDLVSGQQYRTLTLASGASFPDAPGWICVSFGTSTQVDAIPYLGKLSTNTLILDYKFKMPVTNLSGAKVTWLSSRGPLVPEHPEDLGLFYVTSSSAGRVAAITAIQDAVAAGMDLDITVQFPGDRGLGNAGKPDHGSGKLSDAIRVWGSNDIDADVATAEES